MSEPAPAPRRESVSHYSTEAKKRPMRRGALAGDDIESTVRHNPDVSNPALTMRADEDAQRIEALFPREFVEGAPQLSFGLSLEILDAYNRWRNARFRLMQRAAMHNYECRLVAAHWTDFGAACASVPGGGVTRDDVIEALKVQRS